MAQTINADDGVISGSAGLKSSSDGTAILSLQTKGTTALTVDGSQNVGIGTSSPANKLDVEGAGKFSISTGVGVITNRNVILAASDTAGQLIFQGGSTASATAGLEYARINTTADDATSGSHDGSLNFFTTTNGTSSIKAKLDSSGNLGLGTTSPSTRLHAAISSGTAYTTSSAGNVLTLSNSTASGYAGIAFNTEPSAGNAGLAAINSFAPASGDSVLAFSTRSSSTLAERARITSGGDLLVNNTATIGNCRVEITDSGNSEQLLISGANQTGIQIRNATGGAGWIIGRSLSANNVNDFFIFDAVNGLERIFINTAGEVIISGQQDNGAYNLQCNGTGVWGAGAYVNGSDERLKDNIQSLDSGLDVVKAMRAVTFQYKPEHSKDQSVQPGFIAQELQQAMAGKPYLEGVVQAGPEYLNVAYQNIIPILVKAIQELEAKVAALEAK